MELKYIWIDEYRVIENLGVNFNHSGEHKFKYGNEILHLIQNIKSPIDFGRNIIGVTAIAGENGSGKSSLCEAILYSTATYTHGSFGFKIKFKGIVCYGDHIFIYEGLEVKNIEELKQAGYKVVSFKDSPFEEMKSEWRETFAKGGFVYYSNILDYRTDIEQTNLANISTLASLQKSFYYSTSYAKIPLFIEQTSENRDKDKHGPFQIHYNVEGNRIVKFYLSNYELSSFINVREFTLKCTYSGNNRWLDLEKIHSSSDEEGFFPRIRLISEIQNEILDLIFDTSQSHDENTAITINQSIFKQAIKYLYRYNLLIALSIRDNILPERDIVYDFVFSSTVVGYEQFRADMIRLLELHDLIVDRSLVLDEDEFKPASLASYFREVKDWRFYLIENYYLVNDNDNRALILEFINLEEKLLKRDGPYRRITNLNVTPLSSGESSMLTFFARINDVIERYTSGIYKKDNLILFIDEAEVGFHPAWKRAYFNKLLYFLNNYIEGYKFQIIITTHSPYLLSDLPNQNIVLLKRRINEKTSIVDSESFYTFGANINELLATSFFLEEGLIGEFSQNQIQNLIDNLQLHSEIPVLKEMSKDQMSQMIDIIAEPFLQEKLRDMFYEKFPDDEQRQTRITELEEQLRRLKNG